MTTYCVVGGGVAGVSCLYELIDDADCLADVKFVFVCGESGYIKTVESYKKYGSMMEHFQVRAKVPDKSIFGSDKLQIFMQDVVRWQPEICTLELRDSHIVRYNFLCIATGALPKTISTQPMDAILQIRDMDTIDKLQQKLSGARRVVIVGDGGISMEAAYELKNMEIFWASKAPHVGTPFFDATLALLLEERFEKGRGTDEVKREVAWNNCALQTSEQPHSKKEAVSGCSLGPNWLAKLKPSSSVEQSRKLTIMRCVKVVAYHTSCSSNSGADDWNVYVEFDNGEVIGCDFVVEAIGAYPNSAKWKEWCPGLQLTDDLAIEVNKNMQTSIPNVYACGDVCAIKQTNPPRIWKQMKLWTQARTFGLLSARCMLDFPLELDSCLDMFTHITTFAGYKVVLLGDHLAETDDVEHVVTEEGALTRIAIDKNCIVGAILVGPTDLDEVLETLILNSFNIAHLPRPLVNQQLDLAHYFD